ncbi:MAG: DUF1559 domain-containing protein [Planctomycetota bacterium]|nr:DUF1559 domain-containing protein [Planctomycetota bacterium]
MLILDFTRGIGGKALFRKTPAFAVVELMVVIAICVILLSILLLGVIYSREVARRMKCTNNLKQIGIALHNYESAFKMFPRGAGQQGHGPLVSILPYVELQAIYSQLDLNVDVDGNPVALNTRIDLYRCPSAPGQDRICRTDYVLNQGITLAISRKDPWFFEQRFFPKTHHFSKGLEGTALLSETCGKVGSGQHGAMLKLSKRNIITVEDSDEFLTECLGATPGGETSATDNGHFWFGAGTANYFHILNPNKKSCGNGGHISTSLYSATSMHSGGVNTLFADARVDFMADSVDSLVWQQFGTR